MAEHDGQRDSGQQQPHRLFSSGHEMQNQPDEPSVGHPLPVPVIFLRSKGHHVVMQFNWDVCEPVPGQPYYHSKATEAEPGLSQFIQQVVLSSAGAIEMPQAVIACSDHMDAISEVLDEHPQLMHTMLHLTSLISDLTSLVTGHALSKLGYHEMAHERVFKHYTDIDRQNFTRAIEAVRTAYLCSSPSLDVMRFLTQPADPTQQNATNE